MAKKLNQYDWKKTLTKAGRSAAIVGLTGVLAVYGQNPAWFALVPIVEAALNWLKHRNK